MRVKPRIGVVLQPHARVVLEHRAVLSFEDRLKRATIPESFFRRVPLRKQPKKQSARKG